MKKILLTGIAVLLMATSADAQSILGARFRSCGSSWAICKYRMWVRNHSPAEYHARQQRIARKCTPATVWKDACR